MVILPNTCTQIKRRYSQLILNNGRLWLILLSDEIMRTSPLESWCDARRVILFGNGRSDGWRWWWGSQIFVQDSLSWNVHPWLHTTTMTYYYHSRTVTREWLWFIWYINNRTPCGAHEDDRDNYWHFPTIECLNDRQYRGYPLEGVTLYSVTRFTEYDDRLVNYGRYRVLHSMWIHGNFTLYSDKLVN